MAGLVPAIHVLSVARMERSEMWVGQPRTSLRFIRNRLPLLQVATGSDFRNSKPTLGEGSDAYRVCHRGGLVVRGLRHR